MEESTFCPNCGHKNNVDEQFCSFCGQKLIINEDNVTQSSSSTAKQTFCPNCGIIIDSVAAYCENCGYNLKEEKVATSLENISNGENSLHRVYNTSKVHCPNCDNELDDGALFCEKCGKSLTNSPRKNISQEKSNSTQLKPIKTIKKQVGNNKKQKKSSFFILGIFIILVGIYLGGYLYYSPEKQLDRFVQSTKTGKIVSYIDDNNVKINNKNIKPLQKYLQTEATLDEMKSAFKNKHSYKGYTWKISTKYFGIYPAYKLSFKPSKVNIYSEESGVDIYQNSKKIATNVKSIQIGPILPGRYTYKVANNNFHEKRTLNIMPGEKNTLHFKSDENSGITSTLNSSEEVSSSQDNAKLNVIEQNNVDPSALTEAECIKWAVSYAASHQEGITQSDVDDSIAEATLIPATESSDNYVHIDFKLKNKNYNYYINGNYQLVQEGGNVLSKYPTEISVE